MSSDCSIICGLPDPPWEAAGRDLPPAPQARVDGPDQGKRGDRGVSRTVFVGLAHARTRNGQRTTGDRITSNCICPGAVDTPMWRKIDAEWSEIEGWQIGEAWKRRTSLIPLGRPETPEDVAGVMTFLASRDSDYMTGQAVNVDGGLVMGN